VWYHEPGRTLWIDTGGLATSSSSGFTRHRRSAGSITCSVIALADRIWAGDVSTGALTLGALGSNSAFAGGGSFTIAVNGAVNGLPNAVLFQGAFSSPVTVAQLDNGSLQLAAISAAGE